MTAPPRICQMIGWFASSAFGQVASTMSAAASWVAFSFVADSPRTISTARIYISTVTGSLASGDITADLYSSQLYAPLGSSVPNTPIETGKLPTSTIAGAGFYTFNGFSTALTSGTTYWIVFKNINGSPTSNNCALRACTQIVPGPTFGGSSPAFGWGQSSTVNSGSTWTTTMGRSSLRVGYADGSFDGFCVYANTTSSDLVYSTRESGAKFTSPSNAILNVAGLAINLAGVAGTPTGSIRLGLWTGATPTLVAYTRSIAGALLPSASGAGWVYAYFASTQQIAPNTIIRVTLGETSQGDSSSNAYRLSEYSWDTDASSLTLLPFAGTLRKTYFDGSSWTDNIPAGGQVQFAILLSSTQEFSVPVVNSVIAFAPVRVVQSSTPTIQFANVDSDGNAISLSGKTVTFVAWYSDDGGLTRVTLFTHDNDSTGGVTISGDDSNLVSVDLIADDTGSLLENGANYDLTNTTDGIVISRGAYSIEPATLA